MHATKDKETHNGRKIIKGQSYLCASKVKNGVTNCKQVKVKESAKYKLNSEYSQYIC